MTAINFYSNSTEHFGSLGKDKSFDFCLRFECLLHGSLIVTNGKRNLSNKASVPENSLPGRIYWVLRYILVRTGWAGNAYIKSQNLKTPELRPSNLPRTHCKQRLGYSNRGFPLQSVFLYCFPRLSWRLFIQTFRVMGIMPLGKNPIYCLLV
jgi:hypothetical protein